MLYILNDETIWGIYIYLLPWIVDILRFRRRTAAKALGEAARVRRIRGQTDLFAPLTDLKIRGSLEHPPNPLIKKLKISSEGVKASTPRPIAVEGKKCLLCTSIDHQAWWCKYSAIPHKLAENEGGCVGVRGSKSSERFKRSPWGKSYFQSSTEDAISNQITCLI